MTYKIRDGGVYFTTTDPTLLAIGREGAGGAFVTRTELVQALAELDHMDEGDVGLRWETEIHHPEEG